MAVESGSHNSALARRHLSGRGTRKREAASTFEGLPLGGPSVPTRCHMEACPCQHCASSTKMGLARVWGDTGDGSRGAAVG
jgi:hypothetical protein